MQHQGSNVKLTGYIERVIRHPSQLKRQEIIAVLCQNFFSERVVNE
jgi:hypothetical protein